MKRPSMYLTILAVILGVMVMPNKTFAQEERVYSLDVFIQEALKNNPRITQAYNEWKAAEYKVKQVTGLPDPKASYTFFGENVETRTGPQEQKFGLSQKVPFPGKLSLKGKSQRKHAAMAQEEYEAVKREVIKNVKFAYYDLFWVDKALRITKEEKEILENLEKVALRKYEANQAPQQDVIKAQVELSKLINKLSRLHQNRKGLEARMNSILNRAEGSRIEEIFDVNSGDFLYALNELSEMARESRQELVAANLAVERAQYEKSLARLDYFPDFTFGAEYIEVGGGTTTNADDGRDAWMGTISVNIPIWFDKLGAQLNEKRAKLKAAQMNEEGLANSVIYEMQDIYFKVTAYRDIMGLYETALIPQSDQAFDAARIGYESGTVDFLNWLDAQRTLLQTRLAYYKTVSDYHKSIAYLERVVGQDLQDRRKAPIAVVSEFQEIPIP